jgi:hypothetical protein
MAGMIDSAFFGDLYSTPEMPCPTSGTPRRASTSWRWGGCFLFR